jgi:hypothetical protein
LRFSVEQIVAASKQVDCGSLGSVSVQFVQAAR